MKFLLNLVKYAWRALNFIRDVVMNLFFLAFILLALTVFGLVFSYKAGTTQLVGNQGALLLNLDGYLADNRDESLTWQKALQEVNSNKIPMQISTFDVVYAVENAKDDERIKGLVLDLNFFEGADLPALDYVGNAIQHFKTSGKPVIVYADNYTQAQYYLASFADEIYLNPAGAVDIRGMTAKNLYFKSMLDKLDITPHVFRVGTYKSAVEPFLRDDMSPEAKANAALWVNGMWDNYKQQVAQNRTIQTSQILPEPNRYLQDLKALNGDNTRYAEQRRLVTTLATSSEMNEKLTALFGKDDEGTAKRVDLATYLSALPDRLGGSGGKDFNIAVVNVEGTIIDGESDDQNVGGDTVVKLLQQAQTDERIKALVLRVNSPGGSAFASEKIRQELTALQKQGKPVVVSMGGMAASGGYWISSTADYIVADKNTLTGSIGIFAMFPTFEKTAKNIGVTADGISTSPLADISSLESPSKVVKDVYQLEIEHGYDEFLRVVSEGRRLDKEQVDQVAQGQVWLGQDAAKYHLVDALGNFDAAVNKAFELATQDLTEDKKPDYSVSWLVDEPQGIRAWLKELKSEAEVLIRTSVLNSVGLPKDIRTVQKQLGVLNRFNDPKGQYLYCLNCGTVK
ncbi:signal peptide peptidase SppA [Actinobacillus succinogenes]|uniref:Signal peptide peptidase SppA, 67K type n=1 Tax=Actinobacillus succinogenes (strain ATCC 55618 / DSM 22257 / CCUG 43843 / 130Z) TaxID=339671 RepID=A6VPM8_ACTSZ|nr:signal peptide peptidase SppA [Actinobacillus succinogenes]ABR74925.1 signal peptide peptidase SppA, 67K type [Actinobacillus succinogenes 130Z]PHI40664.1 signal peptide peptidase SppA [Actinobacillus succinogenes]